MINKVKIREMKISDVPKIIEIGKKVKEFVVDPNFKGFWSKEQLENWVNSKTDSLVVAESDKKIVGFVMLAHHVPTGKVTFENAWVDKDFRGEGIVGKLVKMGLKTLEEKGATYMCTLVKTDNIASIKFLEKNKFHKGLDFTWLHRKI